jgi:hypothetical protein
MGSSYNEPTGLGKAELGMLFRTNLHYGQTTRWPTRIAFSFIITFDAMSTSAIFWLDRSFPRAMPTMTMARGRQTRTACCVASIAEPE